MATFTNLNYIMKKIFTLFAFVSLYIGASSQVVNFHDYSAVDINGDTISMSQYYGKKVMVINCASFCAFTPQYTPLDTLYARYNVANNFEIIGFPSNDFLNQGGTDSQIITTCHTYGVEFKIMQTVNVVTGDTSPIFKWLQRQDLNGVSNASVDWNFNKFLVDEQGHWVRHFVHTVDPLDTAIINWITGPALVSGIEPVTGNDLVKIQSSNPTSTSIDMVVSSPAAQHLEIQLFSIEGKMLGTIYSGIATGGQQISHPVNLLPSGMYMIKVQAGNTQQTLKWAVQH
ncbi:MAG: glutathione peroxidase [Bacteroidota bacterium]|nr:glutathione peroxidase [Bacteroidota bacterium]